ncbi:MAG: universal stress protein [Pseudomonadota bacterium]|nr:universal stress protein [Pseudomonadota bacterium]
MSRSAGRIGWLLVWAVVFCDIGSSVYYVPGILYDSAGDRAGIFVLFTLVAFLLLCSKVVEVTRRFPSGGGVVSVADKAFGPWWGCAGGQLIMVDYFLTVAISVVCAVYYVDSVVHLGPMVLPVTLCCLAILCGLNIIGIKESAIVSTVLAGSALIANLAVIGSVLLRAPGEVLAAVPAEIVSLAALSPAQVLVGYAGAWLAFSGLESLAQLAPAMRDLQETPRRGMIAVAVSVLLTAPTLTFLCTAGLSADVKANASQRLIAELASAWGGLGLQIAVVLTATSLLLLAANTAIIGNYHVQLALTKREFLPAGLGALSHRFQTPSRAILLGTVVPGIILWVVGGDMTRLGELYAFGLLGSLMLMSVGIDVLRYRDGERGWTFAIGILTSVAVAIAFAATVIWKPMATLYGGGLMAIGLATAVGTRSGWFERVLARIPRMAPPIEVVRTDIAFYTVAQACELPKDPTPGILVASRGATRKIFREACDRAKSRGQTRVYLLYVDEIPGLFYPQLAAPTPEGLTVLDAGASVIRDLGADPVPVWGLSHSAPGTVVDAAEALGCDTVVIGATQRTFLWHALRGRFIQELLRLLPADIRLIVVG